MSYAPFPAKRLLHACQKAVQEMHDVKSSGSMAPDLDRMQDLLALVDAASEDGSNDVVIMVSVEDFRALALYY